MLPAQFDIARRKLPLVRVVCIAMSITAPTTLTKVAAQSPVPDFHADIAPILRDYCVGCHSGKDAEGGLRLETFAQLKKGGESGSAITPREGKAPLLAAVMRGEKPAMPPKKEPQPSEADIQLIESWLASGAPGPKKPDVTIQSLLNIPNLQLPIRESKLVTALAFSPDGKHLARARYRTVEVLDTKSRAVIHEFGGLEGKISCLQFSPDGTRLAAATGIPGVRGSLLLWNLEAEPKRWELAGQHRDLIHALQWSPDGRWIASGGYDSKIVLWDPTNRKPVRSFDGHNGAVFSIAFHPSGTVLASASADQTIKLWRVRDGARLDTLKEPQGEQYCVSFTADGSRILAAGADNRLRVWALHSTEKEAINPLLETRYAHEAAVVSVVIHPDGAHALTLSRDKTPKLWSLPGLDLVRVLPLQQDTPRAVAYDPLDQEALIADARGILDRVRLPASSSVAATAAGNETDQNSESIAQLKAALEPPAPIEKGAEIEPNDTHTQATAIRLPFESTGAISRNGDEDLFRFDARRGDKWIFEIVAARTGSPLDSKLEVLTEKGKPLERIALQATRSSWLAFRGRDSTTTADFRIQHAHEAELNDFLYCNGEVAKLWAYPNGPDSGFTLYPGFGNRHTFFGTSACAHPLGQTLYIVKPLSPGAVPSPNGLPVFRINYENDDDPTRARGKDSILDFSAPHDGTFLLRVSDTRGFGDGKSTYRLIGRRAQPDFKLKTSSGKTLSVNPGSGREIELTVDRMDGFEDEISIEMQGLPEGFHSTPVAFVEGGQQRAYACVWADETAKPPAEDEGKKVKFVARARISGRELVRELAGPEISLGGPAKVKVEIAPEDSGAQSALLQPLELTIHPGETIKARAIAKRINFDKRIEFGGSDSCKNLPHGVYVDNVGLNGLLIVEGETERTFAITAAKWVKPRSHWIFLRSKADEGQVSLPVLLHVRPR